MELNVINNMGFVDYFLIVYDYVKYAKKNNIPGGVLLFENHTQTVLESGKYKLITTLDEKMEIFR